MRYLWQPELYGSALARSPAGRLLSLGASRLKRWDLQTSRNVDFFVAISRTVQERIKRIYGRESEVIYPGIDLDFFSPGSGPRRDFYLVVSALVPQKRIDLAIEAFNRTGEALVVAGNGPLARRLQRSSNPNIQFLGWLPDEEIRQLYRQARALIFPGTEDFGLVPVEAQACGCPVICLGQGGATETIVDGETGLFFGQSSAASLIDALERARSIAFDSRAIVANASRFSRVRFRRSWQSFLAGHGLKDVFPLW